MDFAVPREATDSVRAVLGANALTESQLQNLLIGAGCDPERAINHYLSGFDEGIQASSPRSLENPSEGTVVVKRERSPHKSAKTEQPQPNPVKPEPVTSPVGHRVKPEPAAAAATGAVPASQGPPSSPVIPAGEKAGYELFCGAWRGGGNPAAQAAFAWKSMPPRERASWVVKAQDATGAGANGAGSSAGPVSPPTPALDGPTPPAVRIAPSPASRPPAFLRVYLPSHSAGHTSDLILEEPSIYGGEFYGGGFHDPRPYGRFERVGHVDVTVIAPNSGGGVHLHSLTVSKLRGMIMRAEVFPKDRCLSLVESIDELGSRVKNALNSPLAVGWIDQRGGKMLQPGQEASIRLDVFFGPKIYDLHADYDIHNIMEYAVPAGAVKSPPAPRVPPWKAPEAGEGGSAFTSAAPAAAEGDPLGYWFTIPGLMRSLESPGWAPMPSAPPGLRGQLFEYQLQTVQWMMDREKLPGGLNSLFWEEREKGAELGRFWYNRMAGECLATRPPCNTGGFVCEEMGMGKTLEMISLILSNPALQYEARPTLVVVPLAILSQWEDEVRKWVEPGRLVLGVHHHSHWMSLEELETADIVLTTYDVLTDEMSKKRKKGVPKELVQKFLHKTNWHRVVLDESQRIRNSSAVISSSACSLRRRHSWLMSGTPVGHVVEDLLGQILFLGVEPWCRMGAGVTNYWEREVTEQWRSRDPDTLDMVFSVLSNIMIRHSKSQRSSAPGGAAIVTLPPKHVETVVVDFATAEERFVYDHLELRARSEARRLEESGQTGQRFIQVCALRDRLVRAASHASNIDIETLQQDVERRLAEERRAREAAGAGAGTSAGAGTAAGGVVRRLSPAEAAALPVFRSALVPHGGGGGGAGELCPLGLLLGGEWPPRELDCPICLEPISRPTAGPCGHVFDADCILATLAYGAAHGGGGGGGGSRGGGLCPTCRGDLCPSTLVEILPPRNAARGAGGGGAVGGHGGAAMAAADGERAAALDAMTPPSPEVLATLGQPVRGQLVPLYTPDRDGALVREDGGQYHHVDRRFLKFYDVAFAQRGAKVDRVVAEVLAMRQRDPTAKAVIFSRFSNTLLTLASALSESIPQLGDGPIVLTGSSSHQDRARTFRAFREDPDCFVLCLSTMSNNAGLTLTVANHLFLVDLAANSGVEAQLVNRIHRIGQPKPVYIMRLVMRGTVEERVIALRGRELAGRRGLAGGGNPADDNDAEDLAAILTEDDGGGGAKAASGAGGGAGGGAGPSGAAAGAGGVTRQRIAALHEEIGIIPPPPPTAVGA